MDSDELEDNLLLQATLSPNSEDGEEDTYSHSHTAGSHSARSPLVFQADRMNQTTSPLNLVSSSSSSTSSRPPAIAMEAGPSRKRSRAISSPTTSAAVLHDPKTRRHASPQRNTKPASQSGSNTGADSDLLGLFGLEGGDDIGALEEEQRQAETWLQERREQERRDEEFARALQETWDEILPPSSRSDDQDDTLFQPRPQVQQLGQGRVQERVQPRFPPQPQMQRQAPTFDSNHGQTRMMPPPVGPALNATSKYGWPLPTAHGSLAINKSAGSRPTESWNRTNPSSRPAESWQKTSSSSRPTEPWNRTSSSSRPAESWQKTSPNSCPTESWQKTGSNSNEQWRSSPKNYIELSSDSEVEELFSVLSGKPPDPWEARNRSNDLPIRPSPNPNPYANPNLSTAASQRLPSIRALEERYQQNLRDLQMGVSPLSTVPQYLQPYMSRSCPPGCACGGKLPHPYSPTSSQIDTLRNMYASDGLTPDEMKKELKSLLENIRPDQELDLNREGTPEALKFPLMEHQKLGLAWMKSMEEGSNKGGILADDMGLGKTIQALALMVSRPSTDPIRKTTLIIAPVALIQQWKREINRMLKPGKEHQLSVFILHGERRAITFTDLRRYDVVLTTFGTLASELKRKERWMLFKKDNPNAYQNLSTPTEEMPILGDECKWYRVIIDEAQCIKNRNTKGAQACYAIQSIYRWCMSGTPMMNNVQELFSLICFLRIGPYNKLERFNSTFTRPLKNDENAVQSVAMKKLQALLKAILLRRMKTSKIDGKPILQLPPRVTEKVHTIFSEDEHSFYQALETQSQLQFNRYLRAGTVGRNYSNVLVLLLRLRQACCHPHLINDFAVSTGAVSEELDLIANAKLLDATVIERLKSQEASECPVCIDVAENAVIFFPCGHSTCAECFAKISDPSQGLVQGNDGVFEIKCPSCRAKIDPKKVTDNASFQKVHVLGEETDAAESGKPSTQADDTEDSDSDSDDDNRGTLNGFIVRDDDSESRRKKGKGKAKPKKTLAQLKKEAQRNVKAKRKYLRTLDKRWEPSAKVDKTIEILQSLLDSGTNEKTIIFSQFTSLLDLIEVPINRRGWVYRRYDGSMKPADRNESVLDFTDNPECRVMLVSLKAGNAGLNLVAASQVIILDPFWNPYIEDQAIDRAHRIGQMRPVMVHRLLIENTVEDRIIALQEKKREIIEGALDEKASTKVGRLGVRELAFLFVRISIPFFFMGWCMVDFSY
ncbi:RING-13 protein [Arthroderma uncinatum]|uniref:RING-13 protein n=1 Tax=Arthroderma uncinatum TaxID=74035 RepID=UPI00144A5410|nr:RING-13 protein [Arthroderma uncinatum]KAF3490605.1 RING-13 protein [Arthroderma uncinatum]